jgi:hypothetical protein
MPRESAETRLRPFLASQQSLAAAIRASPKSDQAVVQKTKPQRMPTANQPQLLGE